MLIGNLFLQERSCIQNTMAASLFVSPHNIKGYFFKPGGPVFIIVINTSCLGICYTIYAWQKFFHNALMLNGALALFEFLRV